MFHVKHLISHIELKPADIRSVDSVIAEYSPSINTYSDQIFWWNKRVNLVSREVSRETIKEHIRHSLLISRLEAFQDASKIIDAGSGGGLPGLPLAIAHQGKKFILNDIVAKKMMAVKQMAIKSGCENVKTETGSIENIESDSGDVIITKHAFKLPELWKMVNTKPWDALIFLKGAKEAEIEIKSVPEPMEMKIFSLEDVMNSSFYSGKAIVQLNRIK